VEPRAERSVLRPWGLGDALIGLFIAYAGAILLNGLLGVGSDAGIGALFLLNIPLWAGLAATPWWAVSRQGDDPARALGLAIRPVDLLALPLGAGVQVLVGLAYSPFVDRHDLEEPSRRLADAAHGTGGKVLLVLMTVVIAPVLEEWFYRGLVLRSLARGLPAWAAVLLCGLAFGAMHFQLLQLLGLAAFGAVAAALALWSGRLGPAVLAHLGFNAVALWSLHVL
jgi:membrane protease YdiL (CAAX protease family)